MSYLRLTKNVISYPANLMITKTNKICFLSNSDATKPNTSKESDVKVKVEKDHFLYDVELDGMKKQHMEDFVKIVDKFQRAKLVDLQKILVLAQKIQVSYQSDKSSKHSSQEDLTKLSDEIAKLNELNSQFRNDKLSKNKFKKKNIDDLAKNKLSSKIRIEKLESEMKTNSSTQQLLTNTERLNVRETKSPKAKKVILFESLESGNSKDLFGNLSKILKPDKKKNVELALNMEEKMRDAAFHMDVASYVDLCVQTGMLQQAQAYVTSCFLKGKQKSNKIQSNRKKLTHRPIKDIKIYNILLKGWAKLGNYEAIRKLYMQIDDSNLQPTLQTYAACFECLGRQTAQNVEIVEKLIRDVQNYNLVLEDIFLDITYTPLEKELILKAIRQAESHFVARSLPPAHDYSCTLLNHLNDNKPTSNPFHNSLNINNINKKLHQQINIELQDAVVVESIFKEPVNEKENIIIDARAKLTEQKEVWRQALRRGFVANRQMMQSYNDQTHGGISLVPFLKLWNPDVYVDFMMQEVDTLGREMSMYSPACSFLHASLGSKVFNKFYIQSKAKSQHLKTLLRVYREYLKKYNDSEISGNHRTIWNDIISNIPLKNIETQPWSLARKKEVGKFLYNIIMSEVKIKKTHSSSSTSSSSSSSSSASPTSSASSSLSSSASSTSISSSTKCKDAKIRQSVTPAFFTVFRVRNGIPSEEIIPHPFLVRLYEDAHLSDLTFDSRELPLVLPPVPWTSHNQGGHLLNSIDLIRNPSSAHGQLDWIRSLPPSSIFPVYDGLNAVSACPWKINQEILDHVIMVFNSGGNMKLDVPERHDKNQQIIKLHDKMSTEEKVRAVRHNKMLAKESKEMYSLWCTELYRLSIANKYRDETIWFPHSVDFRGRTYPSPPHFNHLGNDLARSLLIFGIGRPLGPNGLDWLKIHLVNLTGFLKRKSNSERLVYANSVMHLVEESADRPFEGSKWWQTSDKPWQTLSCCKEIIRAVRSADPEKYVSCLPVHQDGSCNGLQHYAALGRDEAGARSVSLVPSSVPQDVYSDIVELIEQNRKSDASKGVEIAASLDGFVRRQVVKQSIMTTVYGVTKYGARKQIGGQLEDIEDFPSEMKFAAKSYLTDQTFQSLKKLFHSSEEIQDWFALCSDLITVIKMGKVSWVTPIGWPVIQPYSKPTRMKPPTNPSTNNITSYIHYEKPNSMKQKNAFAPNFIHSLDSTHMFLTAIHCLKAGILYASVHDCFWTHACHVPQMNKICREQFVALHNVPILENLSEHFIQEFGYSENELQNDDTKLQAKLKVNELFRKIPKKGTFDIKQILDSTYFFS